MRVSLARAALATLPLLIAAVCGPAFSAMPGDANGDGKVAVNDALIALRISVGLLQPTAEQQLVCDVSPLEGTGGRAMGDGRIAVADALLILRAAVGLSQLPSQMPSPPQQREPALIPRLEVVEVRESTSKDFVLGEGFWVSGKVIDSTGKPLAAGSVSFAQGTDMNAVLAATITPSGEYKVALPAGRHDVTIDFPLESSPGTTILFRVPEALQVSGDMKKDFVLPALPQFFTVRGTVKMSNTGFTPLNVSFYQEGDVPISVSATVTVLNQSYKASLPAGTYRVEVAASSGSLPFIPGDGEEDSGDGGEEPPGLPSLPGLPSIPGLPDLPSIPGLPVGNEGYRAMQLLFADVYVDIPNPVAVAGDTVADITAPKVYKLTGSVRYTDGTAPDFGVTVMATPSKADTQPGLELGVASGIVMMGKYTMWLPEGLYDVHASQTTELPAGWLEAVSAVQGNYQVAGDQTLDVVVPKLGPFDGKLSGRVLDPTGKPVDKADIIATTPSLPPSAGLVSVAALAATAADGGFSIAMPKATYTVMVQPPGRDSTAGGG